MTQPQRVLHDAEGLNSGTWPVVAPEHFITPVDRFFTRSHASVPLINASSWRLEVDGLVSRPSQFSLEQLGSAFPSQTVDATLVCAGLRRAEFLALGPLPGELPWGPEPVGTGTWSGISLAALLDAVAPTPDARFVEFTGLDRVERDGVQFGFGGSIDLSKARNGEVLLATTLNGIPLPASHGFPLRVIVPGWIGARSVKWLGRIRLLARPSENYFQSKAYRTQREADPEKPRDVTAGIALDEAPVNAVIVEPAADSNVAAGTVTLRGWAVGSGNRPLDSVEVSASGGREWVKARISVAGTGWTWSFWEAELRLPPGPHLLAVRATDASGASQPPHLTDTWNVKGYGNNAWHRVAVLAG